MLLVFYVYLRRWEDSGSQLHLWYYVEVSQGNDNIQMRCTILIQSNVWNSSNSLAFHLIRVIEIQLKQLLFN